MWITIFIQPIINILILIYNLVGDMGLAIIILTVLIQFLLLPLYNKQLRSQKAMKEIQPKLKKIQKKYKDDKEKQSKKMMEFYQEKGVNPLSGCLPLLVQFPIFIALYWVFRNYLNEDSLKYLYSFVSRPETLDTSFFGLVDLTKPEVYVLPLLAAISSYFQMQLTPQMQPDKKEEKKKDKKKKDDKGKGWADMFSDAFSKQMKFAMPLISFVIVIKLPAAVGIYWVTRNVFTIIQQKVINSEDGDEKKKKDKKEEEENKKKKKKKKSKKSKKSKKIKEKGGVRITIEEN